MFHQPISFKDLLSQNDYDLSGMTPKEQNALCRNLGHRFINAINKVSVINPHSLVASAILNGSKKRFSYDQLKFRIETYMNYLNSQEVKLADTLFLIRIMPLKMRLILMSNENLSNRFQRTRKACQPIQFIELMKVSVRCWNITKTIASLFSFPLHLPHFQSCRRMFSSLRPPTFFPVMHFFRNFLNMNLPMTLIGLRSTL